MQTEITQKEKLLGPDGNITNPGFAKKLLWQYDRNDIKAPKALIKEWDYYYIGNDDYCIALTVADMGYIGALSASFIDFKDLTQVTKSSVFLFPMGKVKMPTTSEIGDVHCKNGKVKMDFYNDGKTRHLVGEYPNFCKKESLFFDFVLYDEAEESMVIATPFDKKKRFYYNQKINCLKTKGEFRIGEKVFLLNEENKSLGTLDWGRGCWTYDNTWYWGSLQAILDNGEPFGFNIGYGFGNTTAASENMIFYKGKSHKIEDVTFNIPMKNGKEYYMENWTFTSSDGRFEMNFEPIFDRCAPVNLGVFCMIPHQVFGRFSGKAILDDGKVIEIKNLLGFAEKVHNKW